MMMAYPGQGIVQPMMQQMPMGLAPQFAVGADGKLALLDLVNLGLVPNLKAADRRFPLRTSTLLLLVAVLPAFDRC